MSASSAAPSSGSDPAPPLAAIILAAGKGKRMKSDLPKVMHHVAGQPMVRWVVKACRDAGAAPIIVIIGHGGEHVRRAFEHDAKDIEFAIQDQQLGTGHATMCALPMLKDFRGDVLVLAGDGPLIRAETIRIMHRRHVETGAAATMATSVIDDPTGYGRIVRDADGRFDAIVEHRNASDEQRAICEVYPSYACFDAPLLLEMLRQLKTDEASGEYYLTEVFAMLKARGERVEIVDAVPSEDVLSINDPQQLAEVDGILRARLDANTLSTGKACAPPPQPSPKGRGSASGAASRKVKIQR